MVLHAALAGALLLGQVAPAGEVLVFSDPPGAEVWVGGVLRGITAADGLRLAGLSPGSAFRLTVRRKGYRSVERVVEVRAGEAAPVTVRLEKRSRKGLFLGAAAAGAGGTAAVLLTRTDPLEVDDDGDGVSEKQGDCLDTNAEVNPGGQFTITVTPDLGGSITCATPYTPIEVKATNLSCTEVGVSRITLFSTLVSGECSGGNFEINLPVQVSLVRPGSRDLVLSFRHFSGTAGCCGGGDCGAFPSVCNWGEIYTVSTSVGERRFNSSYTLLFPAGRSCPACSSGAALPAPADRTPR